MCIYVYMYLHKYICIFPRFIPQELRKEAVNKLRINAKRAGKMQMYSIKGFNSIDLLPGKFIHEHEDGHASRLHHNNEVQAAEVKNEFL